MWISTLVSFRFTEWFNSRTALRLIMYHFYVIISATNIKRRKPRIRHDKHRNSNSSIFGTYLQLHILQISSFLCINSISQRVPSLCNFNPLTPNDLYVSRTAPLTSKHCILYIYSTNTGTEYFKHALYSRFFFSSKCSLFHNANLFGCCIIHILHTECAGIKKIIPAPKG